MRFGGFKFISPENFNSWGIGMQSNTLYRVFVIVTQWSSILNNFDKYQYFYFYFFQLTHLWIILCQASAAGYGNNSGLVWFCKFKWIWVYVNDVCMYVCMQQQRKNTSWQGSHLFQAESLSHVSQHQELDWTSIAGL